MPEQFENGRIFYSKNSLQDFDAEEKYLHPKNRPVSIQKRRRMLCLHHCRVFTRCCFKSIPVRVPFSKSTVFKICRQNMCRFRVNGKPIRRIFHRFQNVPESCERSLRCQSKFDHFRSIKYSRWCEYLKIGNFSVLSAGLVEKAQKIGLENCLVGILPTLDSNSKRVPNNEATTSKTYKMLS